MVSTLEKPKNKHETLDDLNIRPLTPEESAAANRRIEELNDDLYGSKNILGDNMDTGQVHKSSSVAANSVSEQAWSSNVVNGLPVNRNNATLDIKDIGDQAKSELSQAGSVELADPVDTLDIEARVLGGHIDQQVLDGRVGERLDQENAAEVKNALIGKRYMDAWQNKTPDDIDLLKKLPVEVFEETSLMIYQLEGKYGLSDEVTNEDLAMIGESILKVATSSLESDNDEEPKLVYGDESGHLVIQTPEQAIEQIAAGDNSVIDSIDDPELKSEIQNYVEVLNVSYADGLVGIDVNEREQLENYLTKAFSFNDYME